MNKKWEYCKINEEDVKNFSLKFNVSELLAKILINRGITEEKQVDKFLSKHPEFILIEDKMLMERKDSDRFYAAKLLKLK